MMIKTVFKISFFLLFIIFSPMNSFAQLFGADDEDLRKIEHELKKLNFHLENLKNTDASLQGQQENLLLQIEEIKQILPQLQGAVELNKSQTISSLNKTNTKLDDLQAEVKNQVLNKIHQQNKILEQFRMEQENLKEALAQDMEKFEQGSKTNFKEFSTANEQTLRQVVQQLELQSATNKKGFDDTIALFRTEVIPAMAEENEKIRQLMIKQLTQASMETQKNLEAFSTKNQQLNQGLIGVLEKSLKQGQDAKALLDTISEDMGTIKESLVGTNQNLADSHSAIAELKTAINVTNKNLTVADEKMNKLAVSLKALKAQNSTTDEVLASLKAELEQAGKFNNLADEKFNKLIDLSSKLATNSKELESSVLDRLKDSAKNEDVRATKVDLANEKLSRLIEILKTIVKEQTKLDLVATTLRDIQKEQKVLKLDSVATTLSDIQKEQKVLQKVQSDFVKKQKAIKDALADLRRKANVNISRNEDIKKAIGQLSPAKK